MDEENDVLDWGAEDEESKHQDASKHGAADGEGDNHDVEDSVSLGGEEEEQEYYSYQQQEEITTVAVGTDNNHANLAPSAIDAGNDELSTSCEVQREDSSTSQLHSSEAGTPRRNSSTGRRSPPRSVAPRITHALPAKPVVTNVPFLHPSHPSIVEATAMSVTTRTAGRTEATKGKVNGTSTTIVTTTTTGNETAAVPAVGPEPLPRGWEAREARSGSGGTYYYNVRTQESTWTRPVSSSSISYPISRGGNSRRHRGSSSFLGAEPTSPSRSDHPHSQSQQTQEISHHSKRAQPLDHDSMTDLQAAPVPDFTEMTYNDRHYRPGGPDISVDPSGMSDMGHRYMKEQIKERGRNIDPRFNPRPDRAFTPSPNTSPRARERERPISPLDIVPPAPSRGRDSRSSRASRSSRGGRLGNTDADFSTHRDRDTVPSSYPTRGSWDQSNAYQESHRQSHYHYEMSADTSMNESRPSMPPKNGSTRGRRDRDQPMHEENRIQNMSDSRTRSPPAEKRDTRTRDRDYDRQRPMPAVQEKEGYQAIHNDPHPAQSAYANRRERNSRFGQPYVDLQSLQMPKSQPSTYPPRPMEVDDPFVPDDLRSPPPQEAQKRREVFEQLSRIQAAIQAEHSLLPRHPRHDRRPEERTKPEPESVDRDRPSPPSDQHSRTSPPTTPHFRFTDPSSAFPFLSLILIRPYAGRTRPPLPPQSAEFQGMTNRPREQRERPPRQLQDRPPQHVHPNDRDEQASAGPRGAIYGSFRDGSFYREDAPENAMGVHMRRLVQSPEEEEIATLEQEKSHRRRSIDMGPPMDVRRGEVEPDGYSMYPPRGPRSMSSNPNSSSANHNGQPLPLAQTGYGPGPSSRTSERSPPPHMAGRFGRGVDKGDWGDNIPGEIAAERGGRRDRGRASDFPRPPPASTSGTNSLPIGNNRKTLGNGGPSGAPVRMGGPPPGRGGISQSQQRPTRGGSSGRGRGGAPHPSREPHFDRGYGGDQGDRFRNGRLESDALSSRRRDDTIPPFERPMLDTSVLGDRDDFSTSPHDNHFELSSADSSRLARTWTPRGEPPPDIFGDDRRPTSPSLLRESPHVSPVVDTGRYLRFQESRDRPGSSRGRPPQSDGRLHRAERFSRQFDEPRRSGGLEGRLSDRFDDQPQTNLTHALPPNPTLLNRSMSTEAPLSPEISMRGEARREREEDTMLYPSLYNPGRVQDAPHHETDIDMTEPLRPRSNGGRDEFPRRKWHVDRPDGRPSSLLERLEMSGEGNDIQEDGSSLSRSLSDRVQVPSKRDRDEMTGDRYRPSDLSFDGDDNVDPALKKARRKQMRPRKPKRA
ncbi:hypothetical protein H0H87_006768 [Tephrocybe sp. NHM501043]|nr:hypothetical protein H0H87_006768 [Tephrocybe sp. NHM501043]